MKPLVIIAHPDMGQSRVNKRWKQALEQYPQHFTIHELYRRYPNWQINVPAEQALVAAHTHLIFQFPCYWFSSPPLLRLWQDEVLAKGWAYGPGGDKVRGKKVMLAVSTGIAAADYHASGKYKYTMEELLRPFELTAAYTGMAYVAPFIAYGLHARATEAAVESTVAPYLDSLFDFSRK